MPTKNEINKTPLITIQNEAGSIENFNLKKNELFCFKNNYDEDDSINFSENQSIFNEVFENYDENKKIDVLDMIGKKDKSSPKNENVEKTKTYHKEEKNEKKQKLLKTEEKPENKKQNYKNDKAQILTKEKYQKKEFNDHKANKEKAVDHQINQKTQKFKNVGNSQKSKKVIEKNKIIPKNEKNKKFEEKDKKFFSSSPILNKTNENSLPSSPSLFESKKNLINLLNSPTDSKSTYLSRQSNEKNALNSPKPKKLSKQDQENDEKIEISKESPVNHSKKQEKLLTPENKSLKMIISDKNSEKLITSKELLNKSEFSNGFASDNPYEKNNFDSEIYSKIQTKQEQNKFKKLQTLKISKQTNPIVKKGQIKETDSKYSVLVSSNPDKHSDDSFVTNENENNILNHPAKSKKFSENKKNFKNKNTTLKISEKKIDFSYSKKKNSPPLDLSNNSPNILDRFINNFSLSVLSKLNFLVLDLQESLSAISSDNKTIDLNKIGLFIPLTKEKQKAQSNFLIEKMNQDLSTVFKPFFKNPSQNPSGQSMASAIEKRKNYLFSEAIKHKIANFLRQKKIVKQSTLTRKLTKVIKNHIKNKYSDCSESESNSNENSDSESDTQRFYNNDEKLRQRQLENLKYEIAHQKTENLRGLKRRPTENNPVFIEKNIENDQNFEENDKEICKELESMN